jgi:hypothetical protein
LDPQKGTFWRETASFDVLIVKIGPAASAGRGEKNEKNKQK